MGENTKIEWADHTFNGWIGCTKVSPACDHCYAERLGKRFGVAWGPGQPRRRTSEANWRKPLSWNRRAAARRQVETVFCNSLSDVFDTDPGLNLGWRDDLMRLIEATPWLQWLVLTKRPKVAADYFQTFAPAPDNLALGTTVENQAMLTARWPHLARAHVSRRFLSCEPLLGPLDLERGGWAVTRATISPSGRPQPGVDWVIAGGESGPGARATHQEWVRELRDQCRGDGVPFFFKQWGEWAPTTAGMALVGRARSGRRLDGRDHNAVPPWPVFGPRAA